MERLYFIESKGASNVAPALREIGEQLKRTTHDRMGAGIDPAGDKYADYAPLHPLTIAKKTQNKDKILIETGHMMNETISYDVIDNVLSFGSSARQAPLLQNGGFTTIDGNMVYIPPRPFIGVSESDKDVVLDILRNYLLGSV